MTKNIGILLSGRGSNFEALADSVAAGRIPDARHRHRHQQSRRRAGPGSRRRARHSRARDSVQGHSSAKPTTAWSSPRCRKPASTWSASPDSCACSRPTSSQHFRGRILNIHPSLLPAFPGLEAQRQALEYGVKFSGCTVHFVDENLDAGPIVAQAIVPIEPADTPETLAARILAEEHRIYTEAVRLILSGQYPHRRPPRAAAPPPQKDKA